MVDRVCQSVYNGINTEGYRRSQMKSFRFVMTNKIEFNILARDFRSACLIFERAGHNPRSIEYIEER